MENVIIHEGYIDGTFSVQTYETSAKCPACNKNIPEFSSHREKDCYRNQVRAKRKGRGLPFYVVSVSVERCYGGPEEGGWYYDWTSINEIARVFTAKQALQAVRRFKNEYPTCPRGRYSVLGQADTYVQLCYDETEFPSETKESPRYE